MPAASPRPVRFLLIASLAVNVLLGAALATGLTLHFRSGAHGVRTSDLPSPRALARHLSEEERAGMRLILDKRRASFRGAGREVIEARRQVRRALAAEPFEAQELAAALAKLRNGHGRLSLEAQATLVELAAQMDAEGRQRLARAILRPERDRGDHQAGDRPLR